MARRRVHLRSDMRPDFRPSDEDRRYALRWAFGSREEMHEMFRELEAKMVEDMRTICEQAKRARDAEWPLPPEDESQSDERAAMSTSSPQGAQVMKAATPEVLKTGEAHVDKPSR